MRVELFLGGSLEKYLIALFQAISEIEERELTEKDMIEIIFDLIEKGIRAKWLEIHNCDSEEAESFGELENNIIVTFFGDEIEIRPS